MSSHHIVREKQEPALYIHHLGTFSEEYLGQLLEWSPTLIVNASAYEKVISLGLKVDIVVASGETESFQENTKVINTSSNGDLATVLDFLLAEKYAAVNIIDSNSNLRELVNYISKINIVAFTETEKSYAVKSGFKVWKPKDRIFKIAEIPSFESSNLKQNENGEFVVMSDGFVEFIFKAPYLFISELL